MQGWVRGFVDIDDIAMKIGLPAGRMLLTIATRGVIDGSEISIVCGVEQIVAGPPGGLGIASGLSP